MFFQKVVGELAGRGYFSCSSIDPAYFGRKTCLGDPGRAEDPWEKFQAQFGESVLGQ